MGRKRVKKFIDPKNEVVYKFKVISRSQQDPLAVDENAPQGVLVTDETTKESEKEKYGIYFDDQYNYLQHLKGVKESINWESCDEEVYTIRNDQKKEKRDGTFGLELPSSAFESCIEEPVGFLTKAAPVTGPQPDLDHDVVAELDRLSLEDYSDDGDMPDDFITMLTSEEPINVDPNEGRADSKSNIHSWLGSTSFDEPPPLESSDEEYFHKERQLHTVYEDENDSNTDTEEFISAREDWIESEDLNDDEENFDVSDEENEDSKDVNKCAAYLNHSLSNNLYSNCAPINDYDPLGYGGNYENYQDDEENRKRFSSRSVTSRVSHSSSVLPRSELMDYLGDKVEYVLEKEYTKDKWGELDGEEIRGHLDIQSDAFDQYFDNKSDKYFKIEMENEEERSAAIHWVKESRAAQDPATAERVKYVRIPRPVKEKYNCETIIAARANYANQPTTINCNTGEAYRINFNKKGFPIVPENKPLTKRALAKHNKAEKGEDSESDNESETQTLRSMISVLSFRPKGEESAERRERKSALKDLRRERRKEKKTNKDLYREDSKKQIIQQMNIRKSRGLAVA